MLPRTRDAARHHHRRRPVAHGLTGPLPQLKAMGIDDVLGFDFMDAPPKAAIIRWVPSARQHRRRRRRRACAVLARLLAYTVPPVHVRVHARLLLPRRLDEVDGGSVMVRPAGSAAVPCVGRCHCFPCCAPPPWLESTYCCAPRVQVAGAAVRAGGAGQPRQPHSRHRRAHVEAAGGWGRVAVVHVGGGGRSAAVWGRSGRCRRRRRPTRAVAPCV